MPKSHIHAVSAGLLSVALMLLVLVSAQAQSGVRTARVDPDSGLSYYELINPAWEGGSISISPDGSTLAVAEPSGTVALYNAQFRVYA